MTERTDQLRKEWDNRSERLGATQRAVLFKRFPDWMNKSIHRQHVHFVDDNCPQGLSRVLDVGCGYGRISVELARRFHGAQFQGIDLSKEFAKNYEKHIGPCFNGPVQEFCPDEAYDLILIVTTLMYLSAQEHFDVLQRLWSCLVPGGRIVCIEPASELFVMWRRLTGRNSASPTGGTVEHFLNHELVEKFAHLPGRKILETRSVKLLPMISATVVHHCVAVEKQPEVRAKGDRPT
jgi:SAM-dependent methyltransferase